MWESVSYIVGHHTTDLSPICKWRTNVEGFENKMILFYLIMQRNVRVVSQGCFIKIGILTEAVE